jgi:HEPN domain-containing protein
MSAGLGYRRDDLQRLAEAKLADAMLLIQNGRFSNAYYLSGYSVEIGLKACIARQFRAETIPDRDLVRSLYTHNLTELVGLAGLTAILKADRDADRALAANWSTVSEWTEASRYETVDAYTCQLMIEAVGNNFNGVLPWLKRHW